MARETWVQSQVESYQRLKKWYLMPPCLTLSIIRYGSRVKWSNPGKWVAPSPTPLCSKLSKREPSGHPRLWSPTLLTICMCVCVCVCVCVCAWRCLFLHFFLFLLYFSSSDKNLIFSIYQSNCTQIHIHGNILK